MENLSFCNLLFDQMKILFFDYWLKGVANFERLVPELQLHSGIELKMIHVGSWKEPQQLIVNQHKGFVSYDISYYGTSNLYKILKRERPDVVVMLNLTFLLDKAIISFCRRLDIHIIYLAHGRLYKENAIEAISKKINKDFKGRFFEKIRFDTLVTIYNYFYATVFLQLNLKKFVNSINVLLKNPALMTIFAKYNNELAVDKILLFFEDDKKVLIDNFGFPQEKIEVVGNPELDVFIEKEIYERKKVYSQYEIERDYVLYLEDGFVQSKKMTTDEWYQLIDEILIICNKQNLQLVIKLHPRTNYAIHERFFTSKNIVAIEKGDLKNLIVHSCAVISQQSTTITFALIVGKRVLSPRWGISTNLGKNFPDNVIKYCDDIETFEKVLLSDEPTNRNSLYVTDSLGRLDGGTINRIVHEIVSLK